MYIDRDSAGRARFCQRLNSVALEEGSAVMLEGAVLDGCADGLKELEVVMQIVAVDVAGRRRQTTRAKQTVRSTHKQQTHLISSTDPSISCVFSRWWTYARVCLVQATQVQPGRNGDVSESLRPSHKSSMTRPGKPFHSGAISPAKSNTSARPSEVAVAGYAESNTSMPREIA